MTSEVSKGMDQTSYLKGATPDQLQNCKTGQEKACEIRKWWDTEQLVSQAKANKDMDSSLSDVFWDAPISVDKNFSDKMAKITPIPNTKDYSVQLKSWFQLLANNTRFDSVVIHDLVKITPGNGPNSFQIIKKDGKIVEASIVPISNWNPQPQHLLTQEQINQWLPRPTQQPNNQPNYQQNQSQYVQQPRARELYQNEIQGFNNSFGKYGIMMNRQGIACPNGMISIPPNATNINTFTNPEFQGNKNATLSYMVWSAKFDYNITAMKIQGKESISINERSPNGFRNLYTSIR